MASSSEATQLVCGYSLLCFYRLLAHAGRDEALAGAEYKGHAKAAEVKAVLTRDLEASTTVQLFWLMSSCCLGWSLELLCAQRSDVLAPACRRLFARRYEEAEYEMLPPQYTILVRLPIIDTGTERMPSNTSCIKNTVLRRRRKSPKHLGPH